MALAQVKPPQQLTPECCQDARLTLSRLSDRRPTLVSLYSNEETGCMAKRYALLKVKTPKPEGGFWEAFTLGLVDLNSWGDDYYDAGGYPYPDESHAFVHDWVNLGGDFSSAMRKMDELARGHNSAGADDVEARERAQPTSTPAGRGKS